MKKTPSRAIRKRVAAFLTTIALALGVTALTPAPPASALLTNWSTCSQAAQSTAIPGKRFVCIDLVNASQISFYTNGGTQPTTTSWATVNPWMNPSWFNNVCKGKTFWMTRDGDWISGGAGSSYFVEPSTPNSGWWTVNYYNDYLINVNPQIHHLVEFYANYPDYDLVVICR